MKKTLLLLPGPVSVAQPVLEAMAWPMINHRGVGFAELLARLERGMKPVFGTDADVLFLGSSGTGGLETAVANCFGPGDVVLSCPIGVFGKRLGEIARTFGCTVEVLDTPLGSGLDPARLAARLKADTAGKIRGVLLTHNETSTGSQNDMAALSAPLRDHGALTIVDSVSGLGAAEFKMDEWGYDVVVTASQKALAAPPGVAMVAASERAWIAIERNPAPRFYFDLRKAREFSRKGQTPWTPPISIFYALAVALERYHTDGLDAQMRRHADNARAVRAAFEALGFTIFSRPDAHSVTVVAAIPPGGVDAAELLKHLHERYGVVLSGGQGELTGKIVRFGTMGDIAEYDILGAIGALESALGDIGATVTMGTGVAAAANEFANRVSVGASTIR
ncbi:MAG TPA: alanine--glyoxylate aminotransferase family protein [Candidatus Baltobacteraceae bacterium]|jgi:aspartate aminotransferase-like enzyme|nr:alanine--glyoxylate aminotransferase family protein [Candidatus Baltobacteraceae bacterium]